MATPDPFANLDRLLHKYRRDVHLLADGATPDAIAALESHLGRRLPHGLRELLARHNGGELFRGALRLRSTSDITIASDAARNVILFADQPDGPQWAFGRNHDGRHAFGTWDGTNLEPLHSTFQGWFDATLDVMDARASRAEDRDAIRYEADADDAWQLLHAGLRALHAGRPEDAAPLLERATQADPTNVLAWQRLGDALAVTDRVASRRAWLCALHQVRLPLPWPGAPILDPEVFASLALYKGLRYQPGEPDDLTRTQGAIVREFLRAAKAAGLKTFFQIQSVIPPDYIVTSGGPTEDDKPRLPDGTVPKRRVGNTGSLASPDIRRYTEALITDLFHQYPEVDGLRVDWPEYPQYTLDDAFLDFSVSAEAAAKRLGFDFARMRSEALALYRHLHGNLTDADLRNPNFALLPALGKSPGLRDLSRFKATLTSELLAGFRSALTAAGGPKKELVPNAFPPPFSFSSGMDYRLAARHANGLSVKLYTMHWPMILRFYGDALLQANPGLSEDLLTQRLVATLGIADGPGHPHLADYSYPDPETPHHAGVNAQRYKIETAQKAAGNTPVYALAHGYGPLPDFEQRLGVAWSASRNRVWINRYGYLTEAKIDAIGRICR